MRVERLSCHRVGGAIPEFASSQRRWAERTGLFVVAHAGQLRGLGEASPLPGYLDEDLDRVEGELEAIGSFAIADHQPLASVPGSVTTSTGRFAVETAVLDLVGRARQVEACELLADRPVEHCDLSPIVTSATAAPPTCKVKIGRDLEGELALIAELRSRGASVRVDGNRSLSKTNLAEVLARLAELGVALCEEPTEPTTLLEAGELPLPIALDESLQDETGVELARELASTGKLGALVIKPAAVGGLRSALRLAGLATELGAEAIVSHMLDGPIALAAACELALAIDRGSAHGLAAHAGLSAYPKIAVPQLDGQRVRRHRRPGLGVSWP